MSEDCTDRVAVNRYAVQCLQSKLDIQLLELKCVATVIETMASHALRQNSRVGKILK